MVYRDEPDGKIVVVQVVGRGRNLLAAGYEENDMLRTLAARAHTRFKPAAGFTVETWWGDEARNFAIRGTRGGMSPPASFLQTRLQDHHGGEAPIPPVRAGHGEIDGLPVGVTVEGEPRPLEHAFLNVARLDEGLMP